MNKLLLFLIASVFVSVFSKTKAQSWSNIGCTLNGGVITITNNTTDLYVSGSGSTPNDKITQIYGSSWPLGCGSVGFTGTENDIRGLCFYNGEIYASGFAAWPDPPTVYKLSSGGSWTSVGTVDGMVNVLCVYNGELYAGGDFTMINGISVHNIARWNGVSWSDVNGGIPYITGFPGPQIRALAVYNGELYVAGDGFNGYYDNEIARWNGLTWSGVGGGITGSFFPMVKSLAVYNGSLYAGGHFDHAGGLAANNIARWNGVAWSAAGSGLTGGDTIVLALAAYNNELYAGGLFTIAGGNAVNYIARWNGTSWNAVGSGVTGGAVTALNVFKGALVAGGAFTTAGGISSPKIAKWTACPSTISAGGATAFCAGGSVLLTAVTATSYQWMKNNQLVSGATASTYSATSAGNYTCIITNSCGNVTSNQITVTVNQLPVAVISGTNSICKGSSANIIVTFSNAPGPYSFTFNPGGIVVNNSTNPAVIPVSPSVTTNYTLVSVVNANCAGTVSGNANITVNPLPSATITPAGPTTFCSGGSVVLNVPSGANKTYQWKKGANLISGATLSSYTATTGGNYRVIVTNTVTGCSKTTTSATTVTVNALPAATITPQGPTTFCAGGSVVLAANTGTGLTYKWKKGSNYISGATLSNYTAIAGGNYRVQVTNSNGCSKTSALVAVTVPCKEGEVLMPSGDLNVSVFPNPANSEINIVLSSADNFEIEIANILGERVIKEQNQSRIDISMLESGIYFIKIFQGNNFFTEKFLKQ